MREARGEGVSLSEVSNELVVRGAALVAAYRGGTCLSLSEVLAQSIRQRFELTAFVVSTQVPDNILTMWPNPRSIGDCANKNVLSLLNYDTHTNVVVPYLEGGVRHFLRIPTGVGPEGVMQALSHKQYETLKNEMVIENPGKLAVLSGKCLYRVSIKDYQGSGVFNLDLLRGTMYTEAGPSCSMKPPSGYSPMDIGFLDCSVPIEDERRNEVLAYLYDVAEKFRLPEGFVEDTIFLIENRKDFVNSVLVDPAKAFLVCIKERDLAISMYAHAVFVAPHFLLKEQSDLLLRSSALHISAAARSVENQDGQGAKSSYMAACQILSAFRASLLERMSRCDLAAINGLGKVDSKVLADFFGSKMSQVCAHVVGAALMHPRQTEGALNNIGRDLLQKYGDGSQPILCAFESGLLLIHSPSLLLFF